LQEDRVKETVDHAADLAKISDGRAVAQSIGIPKPPRPAAPRP